MWETNINLNMGHGLYNYNPHVVILGMVYYWVYHINYTEYHSWWVKTKTYNQGSSPCTMLLCSYFPSIGKPIHPLAYRFDGTCESHLMLMAQACFSWKLDVILRTQDSTHKASRSTVLPIEQAEPI
jgi:hypothetical protein